MYTSGTIENINRYIGLLRICMANGDVHNVTLAEEEISRLERMRDQLVGSTASGATGYAARPEREAQNPKCPAIESAENEGLPSPKNGT